MQMSCFHFFTHEALQTVSNTTKRTDQSVCDSWKKCPLCCAHYHVNSKKRHKCYHVSCTSCCGEFKDVNHRCYIQPIVEEEPQEQEDDPLEEPLQWQCEDERERKQWPPTTPYLSLCQYRMSPIRRPQVRPQPYLLVEWRRWWQGTSFRLHGRIFRSLASPYRSIQRQPGGTKSLPLSLHVWENAYSLFLTTIAIVMDVRELQALLNTCSSTHDWEILTKSISIPNGWIPMAYAQLLELTAQEIPVSILFPLSSFLMTVYVFKTLKWRVFINLY